jgi:hypothetical protein
MYVHQAYRSQDVPKITIYVPDDLKAAMDRVEALEPNWSGLAQSAFRIEIERLQHQKRSKGKMDAVIERLRASKQKRESKDRVDGYKAGQKWAMEAAEADFLERVSRWTVPETPQVELWRYLSGVLAGNDDWMDDDAADFWERWAGKRAPSDEFIEEFAAGASAVWFAVSDKL